MSWGICPLITTRKNIHLKTTRTENNEEEKREDQLSEEEPEETTEQFHKRNWAFPNEQEFSQDMECESKGLKCQLNTDLDSHKKISNRR